jgi:hypothetical protein
MEEVFSTRFLYTFSSYHFLIEIQWTHYVFLSVETHQIKSIAIIIAALLDKDFAGRRR